MSDPISSLRRLAKRAGVQAEYIGHDERRCVASVESILAALRALGHPMQAPEDADREHQRLNDQDAHRVCEPTLIVRRGTVRLGAGGAVDPGSARVVIESAAGREIPLERGVGDEFQTPEELPIGVHRMRVDVGGGRGASAHATLLAPPGRCFDPGDRPLGVMAPVYAIRPDPEKSCGIATYSDLGRLASWAGQRGAALLGVLPLLATMLDEPIDPSPYSPVSREFWSELYVDPCATPEWGRDHELVSSQDAGAARALAQADLVDYEACWSIVSRTLGRLAGAALGDPARRAALVGRAEKDEDLRAYAAFRAWTRAQRAGWRQWRAPMPDRSLDQWLTEADFRLFLYAQVEADRQLREAQARAEESGAGLYLDLPVGVAPDGFDIWRRPGDFAQGFAVGAPPDGLFEGGQNWRFPPPHPAASRRDGHAAFRRVLKAHLSCCSALRLDHVMALHRLYWIPEGADARDGLYIRYPAEELHAVLAIESHAHRARIIGENLGVVPEEVNRALREWGALGMYVAPFRVRASRSAAIPPPRSTELACLGTHDTPTFAAYWTGADIELKERLGVIGAEDAERAVEGRERLRQALRAALELPAGAGPDHDVRAALDAMLHWLAASEAGAALVTLEDLWLERLPQNVPGVPGDRYPSWRRRVSAGAARFTEDADIAARIERVAAARPSSRRGTPGSERSDAPAAE